RCRPRLLRAMRTMKANSAFAKSVAILMGLTCLIAGACAKRPPGNGTFAVANNQAAKLSDYKGKVVVLDFYATWCEPCRAETPRLVQSQKEYGASGLQVIGQRF